LALDSLPPALEDLFVLICSVPPADLLPSLPLGSFPTFLLLHSTYSRARRSPSGAASLAPRSRAREVLLRCSCSLPSSSSQPRSLALHRFTLARARSLSSIACFTCATSVLGRHLLRSASLRFTRSLDLARSSSRFKPFFSPVLAPAFLLLPAPSLCPNDDSPPAAPLDVSLAVSLARSASLRLTTSFSYFLVPLSLRVSARSRFPFPLPSIACSYLARSLPSFTRSLPLPLSLPSVTRSLAWRVLTGKYRSCSLYSSICASVNVCCCCCCCCCGPCCP
jgi:hypothetical protein